MLAPVSNGKFVAYGGSDFRVDTELKGEVVYVAGTELLIAPYQNYYYLLIEGNRRRPVSNENCGLETKPAIDELNRQVLILKAQKEGLDPMDPDSRMELTWINNQIKSLQAEITNLQLQTSALGCP